MNNKDNNNLLSNFVDSINPQETLSNQKKPIKKVKLNMKSASNTQSQQESICSFYQTKMTNLSSTQFYEESSNKRIREKTVTRDTLITTSKEHETREINLKKSLDGQSFKCANCNINSVLDSCVVCSGNMKVDGDSHILQFFDYLMNFKLGVKGSYCPNVSARNRKYRGSEIGKRRESSSRLSNISNRTSNRKTFSIVQKFSELKELEKQKKMTHDQYNCDFCMTQPIIGTRYHCTHHDCEDDYDMCQQCYDRIGHRHPENMITVQNNENAQKYMNIVCSLLKSINRDNDSGGSRASVYKSAIN